MAMARSVELLTITDPILPRKAGQAISDDGMSSPHPVLMRPGRAWLSHLPAGTCSRDSPPRQDWIMTTLGLPSSAWQHLLLNFS